MRAQPCRLVVVLTVIRRPRTALAAALIHLLALPRVALVNGQERDASVMPRAAEETSRGRAARKAEGHERLAGGVTSHLQGEAR